MIILSYHIEMDSIISLGQKNTLAEYMILFNADNHPPMLEKDLYDSWKSRMELYMQNREHGRMILELVEHGPLIWPTVEENGMIRTKKYAELSAAEKIQADCDMKATNIILQGLPADTIHLKESLINDMNIYKMKMEKFQVNTKFLNSLPPEWSFAVLVFSSGDDPIACLNKAMDFLTVVASSRVPQQVQGRQGQNYSGTTYKGNATSSRGNTPSGQARVVCLNATTVKVKGIWLGHALSLSDQGMQHDPGIPASQAQTVIPHNAAFQTEDLDI
ncbi:hypothetical protein Tco_0917946 [Tanacetum coccineum]